MNTDGVEKLFRTAEKLHVPVSRCGSLVVAFSAEEDETVRTLYERGLANGIGGLSVLSGDEARRQEPALSSAVTSALWVPNAGIVCPYQLTIAAVGNAMDNGADLKLNFEIVSVSRGEDGFTVTAADGQCVRGRYLVNCAGGHADAVAAMTGDGFFTIIPRAGEYMLLDKTEGGRVRHTVFQVPTKEGKGVLVTPTADGNLLVGPTAARVPAAESTETTPAGLDAVARLSKKSVPDVNLRGVITSFTGVRASVEGGDFIIEPSKKVPGLLHVAGIDSPGLTCCVAIAEYAVKLLSGMGLTLDKNPAFDGERADVHAFRHMSDDEKDAYIKQHPDYGKIVCRCETVTEGEIRDALRRNPAASDIDGVKRRTRAGMGRCQGGFCMPYVMRLISEERGIAMTDVTKTGDGSKPLTGRI